MVDRFLVLLVDAHANSDEAIVIIHEGIFGTGSIGPQILPCDNLKALDDRVGRPAKASDCLHGVVPSAWRESGIYRLCQFRSSEDRRCLHYR